MKTKEVVDELTVKRAITRITYEIIERNKDLNKIVLAGIKTRGVFIAHRIQERLEQLENLSVPVVELDTKPYRDDVKSGEDTSLVSVDVTDREVILVEMCFIQAVPSALLLIILSVMASCAREFSSSS